MCQSYIKGCSCGQNSAEMMFGHMVLDESVVAGLYCPKCSQMTEPDAKTSVVDNGWVLELDGDIMDMYSTRMGMDASDVTAERIFDTGFVTWVGMSPDDNQTRRKEREDLMAKHEGDKREQFEALKRWALDREEKFVSEGWRKAKKAVA